ncbi:uncharacterized protein LOC113328935 isoform X2 [Papaver somniferum]|uniref:uncharacterized protein LOC113328935 isoform X2 n=1 Tax=Papaver somniferum TaxID=3469 RepID=UPI000E6FCE9B|nr:uncharacterized protein LOC113328935 isoform X2 [Papaver somniferum]
MGFCQALVTVGGSWPFAYCISVNRLQSLPAGATSLSIPLAMSAYIYTGIFVTVPSMASVFNEYALKSQFNTSIYLQPESERKLSLASSFDYRYLSSCSILSDSLYNCEYAGLKLIERLNDFLEKKQRGEIDYLLEEIYNRVVDSSWLGRKRHRN